MRNRVMVVNLRVVMVANHRVMVMVVKVTNVKGHTVRVQVSKSTSAVCIQPHIDLSIGPVLQ